MIVQLSYGQGYLPVDLPEHTTVIEPAHAPALADERQAVLEALDHPIASAPLSRFVPAAGTVCVLFTDMTRATPNERLIPWVLDYLQKLGVPRERVVLLNQLGTHRPNTTAELESMLTPAVVRNYTVLNHEPENEAALVRVGSLKNGTPALLNRHCVEASLRIVTGFIEPHFFAGFSGGPKGIIPGVAGLRSVMSNHGAHNLSSPHATFGVTQGNPLWEELRDIALTVGPSFLLNVSLNQERRITGVFAGDLVRAHQAGCEFVRKSAMRKVSGPFDIVVTTNSGYPLDLNLYQGVKGMSAAARIVNPGGTIILAAECREGLPAGSSFEKLLRDSANPADLLRRLASPGFSQAEQWQAQIQALIQTKAAVLIKSSLPVEAVRAAHLVPCDDVSATVRELNSRLSGRAAIAVLPQGPLTIPYIGDPTVIPASAADRLPPVDCQDPA